MWPALPAYITDQPQPAAVGSIVVVRPSVQPSWRPGRSAIRIVYPLKSADGMTAPHIAWACATIGNSASAVSGRTAASAGATASASIAPSLSTIVTVPVPVAIVAPPVGADSTTV